MAMKSSIVAALIGVIGAGAAADSASAREVIRVGGYGATVTVSRAHRHVYHVRVPTVVSDDGVVVYGGRHTIVVPGYVGAYYSDYGAPTTW
jgi:hypothetical protein